MSQTPWTALLKPCKERSVCKDCQLPWQVDILKKALRLACRNMNGSPPNGIKSWPRFYVEEAMKGTD